MNTEKVRISVANLVPMICNRDAGCKFEFFSILHARSFSEGQMLLAAVGGGALISGYGKEVLQSRFDATGMDDMDGCLMVDLSQLENVMSFLGQRDPKIYEVTPDRELNEELCSVEHRGQDAQIITTEELNQASVEFLQTVRQPFVGKHRDGVAVYRQFNLFGITLPGDIYQKICDSKVVRLLTAEEVASTIGGSKEGITSDGIRIANNIFSQRRP